MSRRKASEMERFSKLPKWAQDELRILERRVDELEAQVRLGMVHPDEVPEGQPIVADYDERHGYGLPARNVSFKGLDISVSFFRGELQVRGCGVGTLSVIPEVSNSVRIRLERRL